MERLLPVLRAIVKKDTSSNRIVFKNIFLRNARHGTSLGTRCVCWVCFAKLDPSLLVLQASKTLGNECITALLVLSAFNTYARISCAARSIQSVLLQLSLLSFSPCCGVIQGCICNKKAFGIAVLQQRQCNFCYISHDKCDV